MCDGFLAGEHGLDSFGKWQNQTIRRELGEPGHTHAGSSFSRLSQEELDASADERAGQSRYFAELSPENCPLWFRTETFWRK